MILPTYHNPAAPTIMHIDLNSCFASVEQQANPRLRGLPIAVCAYTTPGGCILAPSIEAKTYGVNCSRCQWASLAVLGRSLYVKGKMCLFNKLNMLKTSTKVAQTHL